MGIAKTQQWARTASGLNGRSAALPLIVPVALRFALCRFLMNITHRPVGAFRSREKFALRVARSLLWGDSVSPPKGLFANP